jgi:hypothetical protein
MFALMNEFYVTQQQEQFRADLAAKQWVILLRSADEAIQGFSTVALNPAGTGTAEANFYYSGDTILHPDYWGTQELVKGFFHLVRSIHLADPDRVLYWLLLSKGHRTYMYLPLFFKAYYPGLPERENTSLRLLLDGAANKVFGPYWHPERGLVLLPNDGAMTEALSEASFRKNGEHVTFFLERNPGFQEGHELACLVDLSPDNFLPLALRTYGQAQSLPPIDVPDEWLRR